MNSKPIRLTTAVLAATAAAALLVTGCSSNSSSDKSSTSRAATSAAAGSSAATTSGGAAPAGGSSSASVDGKALSAKFETTCAQQGGNLALALTDQNNSTYGTLTASATITGTDTVQAVGIAGTNGQPYALGFGNGMPGGSAKMTKSGNTYTVTGEGVGGMDMSNPMAGPKTEKFEIVFACSTVVGG